MRVYVLVRDLRTTLLNNTERLAIGANNTLRGLLTPHFKHTHTEEQQVELDAATW